MTKTAQEFIQSSFSPIIATLCSPKVESIVSKNNLSLVELLQPFTSLDWEGQFREPGGTLCLIKNLKLVIRDVNWKPLQPTEARRQLNNAVLHNYDDKTVKLNIDGSKLEIPLATGWFDSWRETYFEVQFPSDHEFTKHFLSCIIVGTTQDDNLIDTYNTLNQQYAQLQNVTPPKLPKWFNNSVLKTYLLLNDVSTVSKERADQAFEILKQSFGANNCYMLSINSKTPGDPKLPNDYWIQYIKRPVEVPHEMSSSTTNLSTTLLEPQANVQTNTPEEQPIVQVSSTIQESTHPLTMIENDTYDNGNSLQTYSFSGSSESMNVIGKQSDGSSEIHGAALNMADIEAIKKFLIDYTSQALLPHVEKQIGQLNEVVANKKGVSRSLLSATKRWFTTGKPGSTTVNNTVIYSSDCPELQLRRLGDLWFLFGQWQRAFDAYHTAKREFYADSAWLCYAGALEMAAISAFMSGESNRKTLAYMEESITTYLNTCRMVQYAVRATLLSVPCLISAGFYGEAAKQLIRMTSEDSDLRSAMLLEQAALCFLKGPSNKIMCRKYAFHIVLAGHRFSKAGQKKHAYRCYNQAYQVYADSGWRLSTDHVQFALGRLAGALRLPAAAARWLAAPLAPAARQPAHQQDAFLREFMAAHQQWVESCDEFKEQLPVLPVPLLASEQSGVLCTGPAPLSSPGRTPATSVSLAPPPARAADRAADEPYWHKLEETLLQVARGSVPMIFKPTTDLYTQKTDCNPIACQGEPIQISITLYNPLKVALHLKDLELLWQFKPNIEDGETPSTELLHNETALASGLLVDKYAIHGQKVKSVLVEGETKKILTFTLTPLRTGRLVIRGLALKLLNAGEAKEVDKGVAILGKLNLQSTGNGSDKLFQITVIPHAPCLQMTFSEIDTDVISGEIKTVDVEFRNATSVDIKNLHLAVSHPDCMSIVSSDVEKDDFKNLYNDKYRQPPDYPDERAARSAARAAAAGRCAVRVAGARARLSLRPHSRAPALYLVAYYETGLLDRPYRLIRHVFRFRPLEIVKVYVTPRRGLSSTEDKVLENMRLAVEVKNVCNEKEENITVEVLEASLLSRQWRLVDFTAAINQDNSLKSRERIHFVLKGIRTLHELPEGKVDYSSIKMSKQHPETNPDINMPPYCKFVTDTLFAVTDPVESIMQEADKSGLIRSMFILRWKAFNKNTGRTAIGQHCLWLDCFTKTVSRDKNQIYTTPATEPLISNLDMLDGNTDAYDAKGRNEKNNVVVFKLDHSNTVDHNFNVNRICMIPVKINVVNCYGVPVTVFIDLTKQQNRDFGGLGWAGALNSGLDDDSKQVGVKVTLEKFESRSLQVRALCAAPGTYQVGSSFAVTTTTTTTAGPDTRGTTHFVNNTSLLVVKQTV